MFGAIGTAILQELEDRDLEDEFGDDSEDDEAPPEPESREAEIHWGDRFWSSL